MVEKLNKLNNWSVKREDRYGPLASRWYKVRALLPGLLPLFWAHVSDRDGFFTSQAQEKPGAVSSKWVYTDWCGGAPFRGAKGGGQMCFATGIGPTDLSSNDVKRQQENGDNTAASRSLFRALRCVPFHAHHVGRVIHT